ncbi:alkylation response protein AidB-like acyl-CoA dehydrogenase [Panacagrimonas perspica]|uniref:Alkylation response protein AidB-like acyl-CoA dehydrogenase n=2 Tax=Panacagrimonas perspica TaxID=381431 RepID=A0A4R7NWX4_9GAMM|nr:acyl-CoA dehydrogenase family protein [Panacagrimonas perspica]TDU25733.1 alkylation response protein AidB-like acyl-CoA dehydrogenase [Panacagrimonas perspica]
MNVAKDAMGLGLRVLNRFAGLKAVDKLGLRKPAEKAIFGASRAGFATVGAASRVFKSTQKLVQPARLTQRSGDGLFDLTPSEEQEMLRDSCRSFADEQLRPAALAADTACAATPELLASASELGIHLLGLPESLGGAGQERSAMTSVLVAEALAHGDLSLAVACLAPSAVSNALVLWGDSEQQSAYLPAFAGEKSPAAALAIQEPSALFDPFKLSVKARRTPDGYVLDGVKSLVPRAAQAELFIVAAHLEGRGPALFIVESSTAGLSIQAEPAMGLRAAATGRVVLDNVVLANRALLGNGSADIYATCISLARVGWCAVAVGTAQAALDYLVPYVNERVAFGEPISHRQAVAFTVANAAIEIEGMRLLTYRAASRAEQSKSFFEETALARRLCADKGMQIGSDAVQLLGGHGFVKEHPAERWYRDLRAVGFIEGVLLV